MKVLDTIGYACGLGADDTDCCMGPVVLQDSPYLSALPFSLDWLDMLYPRQFAKGLAALDSIAEIAERLSQYTYMLTQEERPFLVIGGDHTSAVGTWSGCASALRSQGALGLLWFDAHMDSHTLESSETGNLHGMPLAALLGIGDNRLTQVQDHEPKLDPNHVCLIGVRSFEKDEIEFLQKLGVRIFYMGEIKERGLEAVMQEAVKIVNQHTVKFGISFGMDCLDPTVAPGTGTKFADGIDLDSFYKSLAFLKNHPKLIGLEIAEFNPRLDQEGKTARVIKDMLATLFG